MIRYDMTSLNIKNSETAVLENLTYEPGRQSSDGKDTRCDLLGWSPTWLQRLAGIKQYVVIYGLVGLAQFALGSYMIATITTIEKRFKISSMASGIILSSWDVGSVACMLVMAYIGSRGRKTRWVAAGTFLVAFSCMVRIVPHLVYGPGEDSKMFASSTLQRYSNDTNSCELGPMESCLGGGEEGSTPSAILIIANLILGAGSCVYYTLGVAYLDDNSNKNKLPWLLAVVFCIRMLGPTMGFLLASYCLKIYIDPALEPNIDSSDPRWIGAWWVGWIPLGIINVILATCMLPFPRQLPSISGKPQVKTSTIPQDSLSLKDFKRTMTRLFRNKILMFNSVSSTFYLFGITGYWAFMPKYLETQFHQSASDASFITGSVGLVCTALGVMTSGAFISHFKPNPRFLALWNIIVEAVDVLGHISYAFLGCPTENLQGHWDTTGNWNMAEQCNADCSCGSNVKYTPLCSKDGSTTFYSPCHAGCTTSTVLNTTKVYGNCSCSIDGEVTSGVCPVDCSRNFLIFLVVLCTMRFFSATGRAGNTIIQFRSVNPEDKSVSIALTEAMFAAFAFIPGPIFYGELLDSTCLVWGDVCGATGNCWLYNGQVLRYYLNFTSSSFLFCAMLADIGVWRHVKGLKIYEENDVKEKPKDNLQETSKENPPSNAAQEIIPFLGNGNQVTPAS